MHRNDFGQWGLELGSGDFARDLAALGALGTIRDVTLLANVPGGATAKALASLIRLTTDGVEPGAIDPRAITTCFYGNYGSSYELAHRFSARALAESWEIFIEGSKENYEDFGSVYDQKRVRLELVSHGFDMLWPIEQLSRALDRIWQRSKASPDTH